MVVKVDGEHFTTVQQKGFCCRWSHAIGTIFAISIVTRDMRNETGFMLQNPVLGVVKLAGGQLHKQHTVPDPCRLRSTKSNRHFFCGEATKTQLTWQNVRKMENSAVRAHTDVAERLELLPISPRIVEFREDPCREPLCRVADASARNMQKHSPENLDENNLCPFEQFVPSSLQVVPRFRCGYFRDCSARPPELMYS